MGRLMPNGWRAEALLTNIAYFTLAVILHLITGVRQLTNPEKFQGEGLRLVYELAPIEVWAWAMIATWALLTYGIYRDRQVMVAALAFGAFLCLSRGLLIEISDSGGGGLSVWVTAGVGHLSQMYVQTRQAKL